MIEIQTKKKKEAEDPTFLTMTGVKSNEMYDYNQKFYSQQNKRQQNSAFKYVPKKKSKFKFQLPKLRLSIYNEITKDAVKMFHPNIYAITSKARESRHLDSTSLDHRQGISLRKNKKRMSLGPSSFRKNAMKKIPDAINLNALHRQYHNLRRKNSNIMNAITKKTAQYNMQF